MSADEVIDDAGRKKNRFHFDRHTPEYRHQFVAVTQELQAKCPIAWSDTYDGHWVASGNREVFELARSAEYLFNDHEGGEGFQRQAQLEWLADLLGAGHA